MGEVGDMQERFRVILSQAPCHQHLPIPTSSEYAIKIINIFHEHVRRQCCASAGAGLIGYNAISMVVPEDLLLVLLVPGPCTIMFHANFAMC